MYYESEIRDINDYSLLNLNISGRRYSMTKSKAKEIRGSLFDFLARRASTCDAIPSVYFRPEYNEYFIERSPFMFDIVLQYAYTGHLLHSPVCALAFEEELKFWRLNGANSSATCRCGLVMKGAQCKQIMANGKIPKSNGENINLRNNRSHLRRRLDGVWTFCEDPDSSKKALVFNVICILSIMVSIGNLVIGTVPSLHHCGNATSFLPSTYATRPSSIMGQENTSFTVKRRHIQEEMHQEQSEHNTTPIDQPSPPKIRTKRLSEKFSKTCEGGFIFDLIEIVCVIWFTIEFLLRAVSCPNKWSFVKSPLNIIDFLAICPFYVEIAIWASGLITDLDRSTSVSSVLLMLRVTRVLRAFRVLRLARYFDSLQIMGETLWESRRDMGLLAMFLAVSVLIFSTLLFYIEKDVEGTDYTSIPAAFWWAVVTLTTTGYGDVTPTTSMGKLVTGVACIAGVLILAFPVSILVEHFRISYASRRQKVGISEPKDSCGSVQFIYRTYQRNHDQNGERALPLIDKVSFEDDHETCVQ